MKTAIGYIRVSTIGQATDGVSLDAQAAKMAMWADLNDYELTHVYSDTGTGKRSDNRADFQAALDDACKSGAALVVYSLSRFARNTRETLEYSERMEKAGADLVSLSEKIDTTTAAGKMVFRMLAVLAEFERDQISERTRAALQYKKSQGQRISGRIPFGKDLAADGITLVDNPQEQRVIELIRELRADGLSLRAIAAELERRELATKTGGVKWQASTIQSILKTAA